MELQEYCHNMGTELAGWKDKIDHIVSQVDSLGTEERGRILSNVQDMHMLVEDIEERILTLEKECPVAWDPHKKALDDAHVDMRAKYEETMHYLGDAAPVSVPG